MMWFVFIGDFLLLERTEAGKCRVPEGGEAPVEAPEGVCVHNIAPMADGRKVKTFRMPEETPVPDGCGLFSLRETFGLLEGGVYDKAGKCEEILYWDEHTRFCGICGAPMQLHTDISKRCTACGNEVWPLLSTAVIVLVKRGKEILLARSHTFRGNWYGLIAGFVETGETLEEACRREIREETSIEVENLRYVTSQAWPYPCGLMAGFTAEYSGGEIVLQESELAAAGWFSMDNLPPLPSPAGMARRMVDAWKKGKI